MGKHFAWDFVTNDRLVMLHTAVNPPDDEWDGYLRRISARKPSTLGLLVLTSGGAPTTLQRQQLTDWIGKDSYPRAVVTESMLARGALTALAWFDPAIKAFSPSQLKQAFAYLAIPEREEARVFATIRRLKEGMEVTPDCWWTRL